MQEIQETLTQCVSIIEENGLHKSQMKIFKWRSSNTLCTGVVTGADSGVHVLSLHFTVDLNHTVNAVLSLLIHKWVIMTAIHLIGLLQRL